MASAHDLLLHLASAQRRAGTGPGGSAARPTAGPASGPAVEQLINALVLREAPRLELPASADRWRSDAATLRQRYLELLLRGHPHGVLDQEPAVEWADELQPGAGYRIRKVRFEGYPGLWVPALLYEPTGAAGGKAKSRPAVLNANGHHRGGNAIDYKQARCINLAKRGMVALSFEFLGMGQTQGLLPHNQQLLLDVVGMCGAGVFYVVMKRALDVLLAVPDIDTKRVAMTGLSGGGWQTIFLSALDERIRVAVPVAGHMPIRVRGGDIADIGDAEQLPDAMCTVGDYDTLSALMAPRPTLFIYNAFDDCCFQAHKAVPSVVEPAQAAFELLGAADNCAVHVNHDPGHNYGADNRAQLYRWLDRHFGLDTAAGDLPWQDEVLSEPELHVELPDARATFPGIALERLAEIRAAERAARGRGGKRAGGVTAADIDRVLGWRASVVTDELTIDSSVTPDGTVVELVLLLDDSWPVPALLATPAAGAGVTIRIGDDLVRGAPQQLLRDAAAAGRTMLAVDLLGTGGSRVDPRYLLLLSALGRPPLGVAVSQLEALAQWLLQRAATTGSGGGQRRAGGGSGGGGGGGVAKAAGHAAGTVAIQAAGRVAAIAALLAAARTPGDYALIHADQLPASLDEIVEWPLAFDGPDAPLFCFGLRAALDVGDLMALAPDVAVEASGRGPLRPR